MAPILKREDLVSRGIIVLGLVLIGLGCLGGIIVPAGPGWDFANYYDAGHKALVGQIPDLYDKYALIEGRPPQGAMAFLGAPITSYLFVPLALVSPALALVLFKIENTLCLWLSLALIWRHVHAAAGPSRHDQIVYTALFVVAALLFQPFWTVYRVGGQATPSVLLLLTLGWLAHTSGRMWLSALLFVVAVALKPFLVTGLVLLLLVSGAPFLIATAVIGAVLALGAVLIMGWEIHEVFLRKLLSGADFGPIKYNSGVLAWMDAAFVGPIHTWATNLARAALVGVFIWLARGARGFGLSGAAARSFYFALALAFAIYVTPVTWNHYLAFLFPILAPVTADWRRMGRETWVVVALLIMVSVTQNLILLIWLDGKINIDSRGENLSVALVNGLPLMLGLWLFLRRRADVYAAFASAHVRA
jgi:hypothetical protein